MFALVASTHGVIGFGGKRTGLSTTPLPEAVGLRARTWDPRGIREFVNTKTVSIFEIEARPSDTE
jgi:hypothetical protein